MPKVLIAGATGYLGRFVVQEFKKQGYWVRALARNSAKLESLSEFLDEKFIGEVTKPCTLIDVCKDMDVVFSSIGITRQRDGLTFMDVDYHGNMNLLEEAKKAGISKFVFISVFNAENMKNLKVMQAKLRFEAELKQSRLDYAIIYPNGFFSDMLEYLKMAKKGRGYVFGSGEYRINPIHGRDLAEVCVDAAFGKEKEINAGGPDILTHNEILTIAFQVLNKRVKISRIPIWIGKAFLTTLRIFTSEKVYGPIEFFMSVLTVDLVAPTYGQHHLRDFFLENKSNV